MASVNFVRKDRNNEKRKVSVFTSNIKPATVTVADGFATAGTIAAADVITLGNLPANSIVTSATVQVITGATTGTQTVALSVGGTAVMAAVAVGTAANVTKGTTTVKQVSGAVALTTGIGSLVDGEFVVLIEYIEPDLVSGELTTI
jgi:hypothetical protein